MKNKFSAVMTALQKHQATPQRIRLGRLKRLKSPVERIRSNRRPQFWARGWPDDFDGYGPGMW